LNTVFTKTLLWFFGTVVLAVIAVTIATALTFNSGDRRQSPLGALLRIQLSEARSNSFGKPCSVLKASPTLKAF
jgi:hypothetical protein